MKLSLNSDAEDNPIPPQHGDWDGSVEEIDFVEAEPEGDDDEGDCLSEVG